MNAQDTKFNYKIIFAALVAVIIGILIAFYYSYAQSNNEINFLEQEKELLVKDITLMKTEVDRLSALDEVNEIELQDSRYKVQQLMDSIGRLNFTVTKLKEFKKELRQLQASFDSLKLKNNFLKYNNSLLTDKYEDTQKRIKELQGKSNSLAEQEALQRKINQQLSNELRIKSYLKLNDAEGSGFRLRSNGRPIRTNKASTIEKLRGCVTVVGNPNVVREEKVIYFQFLGPNMGIIEDNSNTVNVNGNTYSKKVELIFEGKEVSVCDFITVPAGALQEGIYTLNVFENEKLLSTKEFQLK